MKISVNDIAIFSLNTIQENVMKNDIYRDQFEEDINVRLEWVIKKKYLHCYNRLKEEWDPKLLARGIETIPLNPDDYAALVFSQPDYKDRQDRDGEQN